jgi:hypothetical protein
MAEVERGWFQQLFAAEDVPDLYSTDECRDADFNDLENADPAEAFVTWRAQCDRAREIAGAASLDDVMPVRKPQDPRKEFSLRWILTHMIEEYARHNGHADLLREAIDGQTGD